MEKDYNNIFEDITKNKKDIYTIIQYGNKVVPVYQKKIKNKEVKILYSKIKE